MNQLQAYKGLKFLPFLLGLLIIPLFVNFYHFYITKNYDFIVEAECDPLIEICYIRDCSEEDLCPPNQLSIYKVFNIKAFDFGKCQSNTCKKECESNSIECTPIVCDEENGDICTSKPHAS